MSEATLNPLECALDEAQAFRGQADVLQAENAKLQETLQRRNEQFGIMTELWVKQVFDNAKLRGLCKDMMAFVEDNDACEHCGHDAECVEAADGELVLPYEGRCLMLDLFADRMCELGMGVD